MTKNPLKNFIKSIIKISSIVVLLLILKVANVSAYIDIPYLSYNSGEGGLAEVCPDNPELADLSTSELWISRPAGYECLQFHPAGYAPYSGNYKLKEKVYKQDTMTFLLDNLSDTFYLDSTIPVDQQNVRINTATTTYTITNRFFGYVLLCAYFVDESGKEYTTSTSSLCPAGEPLPPTPPAPDISCTFNNGNDLTVRLGTIDRSELPTLADSAAAKSVQIPVECTGGDVTVSMKLNYNPMAMGSSQAVKTTANGVGVAISYNDIPISTTDTTTLTFLEGANTLDLDFQAVRDSAVNVADIPTGGFTASAAVVMTQQ